MQIIFAQFLNDWARNISVQTLAFLDTKVKLFCLNTKYNLNSNLSYHGPDVERYAQSKVCRWQDDGPFKFVKQKINQASLEDEGIEEHEEDDDDIKEDGNILNAGGRKTF